MTPTPPTPDRTAARRWPGACAAGLLARLAAILLTNAARPAAAGPAPSAAKPEHAKPTVVLVHGAWADSSSWSGVVWRLKRDGYTVDVRPNPLRGLSRDSDYLASYLDTISGPIVLVGHSVAMKLANFAALDPVYPTVGSVIERLRWSPRVGGRRLLEAGDVDRTAALEA